MEVVSGHVFGPVPDASVPGGDVWRLSGKRILASLSSDKNSSRCSGNVIFHDATGNVDAVSVFISKQVSTSAEMDSFVPFISAGEHA